MSPGIEGIIEVLVIVALVIVPALAISARIALKPIAETLASLYTTVQERGLAAGEGARENQRLRSEVQELQARLRRVEEAVEFHKALDRPESAPELPPEVRRRT